jgi:thymidylate synthase
LHQRIIATCKKGKVTNLILTGEYPIGEANSDWVNIYTQKAKNWQAHPCPPILEFNHGQFIDKYKKKYRITGINYLINELKQKTDSNRACLSLMDMDSIINKKDNPIPSFMLMQVSMSDDGSLLSITSYYRALEVSEFLPINIAENCLVVNKINEAFSSKIKKFSITIHTGIAHYVEHFSCLEKANIDIQKQIDIATKISSLNKKWIKEMLVNKKDLTESRINQDGLTAILDAMKSFNKEKRRKVYDANIITSLETALSDIKKFNLEKSKTSHSTNAKKIYTEIKQNLEKVIQKL